MLGFIDSMTSKTKPNNQFQVGMKVSFDLLHDGAKKR